MKIISLISSLLILGLVAGCDKGPQTKSLPFKSITKKNKEEKKTDKDDPDQSGSSGAEDGEPKPIEINQELEYGLGGIQVKSFDVLKSSIESCFDSTEMTKITDSMFSVPGSKDNKTPDAEGRIKFLVKREGVDAGQDILDLERKNLVGSLTEARSVVLVDSLTSTYLSTLETVANVVAHNCDASIANCTCDTESSARTLLEQCLPAVVPSGDVFEKSVVDFASECSKGAHESRMAIAQLIASYAFAEGR